MRLNIIHCNQSHEGRAFMEDVFSRPLRITDTGGAYPPIIADRLPAFMREHPDFTVDVSIDDRLTDIFAGGFDAGIWHSRVVENDMFSIRIEPGSRARVVRYP